MPHGMPSRCSSFSCSMNLMLRAPRSHCSLLMTACAHLSCTSPELCLNSGSLAPELTLCAIPSHIITVTVSHIVFLLLCSKPCQLLSFKQHPVISSQVYQKSSHREVGALLGASQDQTQYTHQAMLPPGGSGKDATSKLLRVVTRILLPLLCGSTTMWSLLPH